MADDSQAQSIGVNELSTLLRSIQQHLTEALCIEDALHDLRGVIRAATGVDDICLLDDGVDFLAHLGCDEVRDQVFEGEQLSLTEILQLGRKAFVSQTWCSGLQHPQHAAPLASCLLCPLSLPHHQSRQLLCFMRTHEVRPFSPHVLIILEMVTELIASKMTLLDLNQHINFEVEQRTQLLRRELHERQHAENLQRTLFEIAELSTQRMSAEDLYASLHRILKRLFVVENFLIARFHPDSAEVSIEYFVDQMDLVPEKRRFPLGVGMTSYVFRTRQAQLINQARLKTLIEAEEIQQVVGSTAMVSWMGAPMMLQEQIVGVVIVQSYDETLVYSEEELSLLSFVANHMATALGRLEADNALFQAQQDLQVQNIALHEKSIEQAELIHQLQDAQDQLIQSEKLASVGQLAAGVAHEINNPIGFVNANMGTLSEYIETLFQAITRYEKLVHQMPATPQLLKEIQAIQSDAELIFLKEDVHSLLEESLDGLRRVKEIVQSLKDFSRVGETVWAEADIHQGIDSTLNIVKNELKNKASIVKKYARIPALRCNLSQLNQVFLNILVNAGHAIEEKGVITIETGEHEGRVWVRISDTGSGISPENKSKIFEPFFTTKPIGSGTGLGLSVSYGIIKKHQGHIEVESELGRGTSFTIYLPREAELA